MSFTTVTDEEYDNLLKEDLENINASEKLKELYK